MNAKRVILALTLAAAVISSATATQAQSSDEQTSKQSLQSGEILDVLEQRRQGQSRQLEGSWAMTVTLVTQSGRPTQER